MADEENKEVKEVKEAKEVKEGKKEKEEKEDSKEQKTSKAGVLRWVIMAAVVLICAGSGFFLGRLFAGSPTAETTEPSQQNTPAPVPPTADNSTSESGNTWFYDDLEPIVSNLNEPGATRYIRVALTLEMSPELMEKDGKILLKKKTPILKNWLTIYLSSLTLEDTRGDKNLKRIQSQILDALNEKLFPDEKPKIKHVLFKEFAIQ